MHQKQHGRCKHGLTLQFNAVLMRLISGPAPPDPKLSDLDHGYTAPGQDLLSSMDRLTIITFVTIGVCAAVLFAVLYRSSAT